ncbi:MAG TPA: amidohydrolase family protein, partial [Syntrophales bacterium]|nr:amidohydrolase family protein [Syntrophales bacterium]
LAVQTPFLHWNLEPLSYLESLLGTRTRNLSPLKSMVDAGLRPGNGSDAPCTVPDPVRGIWAACNHPNPSESLTVLDALRMHTIWAARLSFDEKERGTLTEGKRADFTVLDRNPLNTPVHDLDQIRVQDLYLGGRRYDRPPMTPLRLIGAALRGRKSR